LELFRVSDFVLRASDLLTGGLAGKSDLSYSIKDEQIEKKRLAQTPARGEKNQSKETG